MAQIASIFRKFVPQFLHMIVLPVFFFTFMLLLRPKGIVEFLSGEWFGVHLTIMSCIIFLSVVITRVLYYYIPMKLNYTLYSFWCLAEIIFMSFFNALYLWLVMDKKMLYFEFVTSSFQYLFFSLIFAYVILALSLRIYEYRHKEFSHDDNTAQRMRFYDNQHNLKIVLTAPVVLYIAAEENYVNIFYVENGRVREYSLRSSMKALDELCQDNGLIRCHRSFYINPAHIKVLRKDKDGIMYAELDADDVRTIPVSKTYYKMLSDML
jgi:hypothetical protein